MSDDGLFGGLPKVRPTVQTKRRAEARRAAATRDGSGQPASTAEAETLREATNDPEAPGIEQLARASAEAAAGTAIAGLRLAGRAAGGLGRALRR